MFFSYLFNGASSVKMIDSLINHLKMWSMIIRLNIFIPPYMEVFINRRHS